MSQDTIESTEEAVAATQAAAWSANVKALFDLVVAQQAAATELLATNSRREREQVNDWHAFNLEQARQNQQIVNRLAQGAATVSERIASDGANFSAMLATSAATAQARIASAGVALDTIAGFNGMTKLTNAEVANNRLSADVVDQFASVAKDTVEGAVASQAAATAAQAAASGFGVVSGPVPQGTTGTAQGGMQMGYGVAIESLMASNATATNAILGALAELNKAVSLLIVKVGADTVTAEKL